MIITQGRDLDEIGFNDLLFGIYRKSYVPCSRWRSSANKSTTTSISFARFSSESQSQVSGDSGGLGASTRSPERDGGRYREVQGDPAKSGRFALICLSLSRESSLAPGAGPESHPLAYPGHALATTYVEERSCEHRSCSDQRSTDHVNTGHLCFIVSIRLSVAARVSLLKFADEPDPIPDWIPARVTGDSPRQFGQFSSSRRDRVGPGARKCVGGWR